VDGVAGRGRRHSETVLCAYLAQYLNIRIWHFDAAPCPLRVFLRSARLEPNSSKKIKSTLQQLSSTALSLIQVRAATNHRLT
jgi:hypothetical protein